MRSATYDAHETARMHVLHGRELASFQARAAAFAIDMAVAAVVYLFAVTPIGSLLILLGVIEKPSESVNLRLSFFRDWYSILALVLYFSLATYFGRGQTPGKRLLRIRVVSLVHDRLNLWHAIERALGYGASALEFGFGFFQYFLNRNRRTVHDRIAETIVVKEAPRPRETAGAPGHCRE